MIDDLVDSLVVDRPVPGAAIKAELAELCKGAEDLAPILWSFRNKEWVRIGTRDILGREPIREVTRELADVAEAIVTQVARDQWERKVEAVRHAAVFATAAGATAGRSWPWASSAAASSITTATSTWSSSTRPTVRPRVSPVDFQRTVRHRGRPAPLEGAGKRLGDRSALRRRRPAPAARRLRAAGPDAGLVPRLLPAVDPDLGTDDPDASPRDLRHRRLRPRGDGGRSFAAGRTDGPGACGRRGRDDATQARGIATPPRSQARARGPGRSRVHRAVPVARVRAGQARLAAAQFLGRTGRVTPSTAWSVRRFITNFAAPTTSCGPSRTGCA